MRRLALIPALLLLLTLPAVVQAQFNYTTNNGTITITGYTGTGGAVTIPSTINGLPVTSIGTRAFYGFSSLTNVTIPNSVTSIGDYAFIDCTSLTSVTIPNSVTSIGSAEFNGCTSMTAITVDALNSVYSSVDGVLFNQSKTTLIQCPGGRAGSYTIPSSVTSIGDEAFDECDNLTSVTIPNSVTSIGSSAFVACHNLTSITIPNSVTSIGSAAFVACVSLTSVTIGNRVTSIGSSAFNGCRSLTSVTIPNSVTSIGAHAFFTCFSLTHVTIPNSVTSIGIRAFSVCTSLTSVTIPNSVTSIGSYAFSDCTILSGVTIGNSVTSIGDYAFQSCNSLTGVYFQGNAPSVSSSVFDGANNSTVYYLAGTTGWGTTFGGRPAVLWNPQVPYTYTTNNGTITITKYFGPGGAVAIPETIDGLPVTSIGSDAFYNQSSLTTVTIPNSVTSIGSSAFYFCTSLTAVYFQGNSPSVGSSVFDGDNNATVYYLPGTTGWGTTFGGRPAVLLDILATDSDGDGLSDYDELFLYGTNPFKADTDGDGIPDGWEVQHGLNPLVNDATQIGPAGVSNWQIYQYDLAHTNQVDQLDPRNPFFAPGTSIYEVLNNGQHTNRFFYDREDRLVGAEYSRGIVIAYQYDGNGNLTRQKVLSRANETNGLPVLWQFLNGLTNNASAYTDTDGDGWTDYQEWKGGSDPNNPGSVPTNAPQTAPTAVVLPGTNMLGRLALVTLRLWDAEGNASIPFLQYQFSSSTNWQNATLASLDGGAYSTSTRVAASPAGVNHAVVWNVQTNLGANVVTNILLRARASDFALLGNWSFGTPFQVNTVTGPDADGNGLPDWWELQYFGHTGVNANADPDGDGFKNWQEYIADTNPTNALSYLHISGVQPVPGGVWIQWQGGTWATQDLQRTFSLGGTDQWLNVFTALPPTPLSGSYTDSFGTNAMQFYRLKATRP